MHITSSCNFTEPELLSTQLFTAPVTAAIPLLFSLETDQLTLYVQDLILFDESEYRLLVNHK